MGLTPREKGKSVMTRSVENIVFSTEMAALDFEPTREEETFLQLIGLDRFITRVTWEILNTQVIQEVINNLDLQTMETRLNDRVIPIFGKEWRQKMKAVFYLNNFVAKREPGTPRVKAADLFPNINDKMKNKLGTCRINDCTIPEARKPLKFFNSLFLLRTSANTISCTTIVHIQNALNGKEVDWPALFYDHMRMELITLKEELYKDKTTSLRTLIGPPLTMLLISEGFLTIQQEIEAGILMPSVLEEKPTNKKRKYDHDLEQGNSSKERENPQILVGRMEPIMTKNVLISTMENGTLQFNPTPLRDIWQKLSHASNLLQNWITEASSSVNTMEQEQALIVGCEENSPATEKKISELESQIHKLHTQYALAIEENKRITAATQTEHELRKQLELAQNRYTALLEHNQQIAEATQADKHESRRQLELAQSQYAAVLGHNHQIAETTQTEKHELQQQLELIQTQYATALVNHQQIDAANQQEKRELQQRYELVRTHLRHRTEVTAIAEHSCRSLQNLFSELRDQTTAQLQTFQGELESYKTQLTELIQQPITDTNRIAELVKLEAFDQWVQRNPETDNQISAQALLHRVTAKLNHTFRNLKTELYQVTTERDELQTRIEQQEEDRPHPYAWEQLLGFDKIEDPGNAITVTMKNLAPPISICQYYQAYKPMILAWSTLPDIRNKTHLSQEQFQALWNKANSAAKDLLVFMWIMKDLLIPKGVVEVTTANPPFYLTRFCVSALTHINRHHKEFYTNVENKNSLPHLDPYEPEVIREIQDTANTRFPEFLSALDVLAAEDTTLLHEANQHHQNLTRKFSDSFPQTFHRIQLHGYITRALDDRKNTLENRQISTPHSKTLLYLPQYDPGSMRIPKRS